MKQQHMGLFALIAVVTSLASPPALLADREPALPEAVAPASPAEVIVPAGTNVPLVMINSVSSKHSQHGDPVYLESVYPVVVEGRIVIPAGSHVSGTVTFTKRPGRVKGRGKLGVQLEQMILPNGVIRSLVGRPGALDGRSPESLDRETGIVKSEGQKGEDAEDIVQATASGASVGILVGAIGRDIGKGVGIGAGAGAAAGIAKVLLTKGPDAMLDRGTHIEMLLERQMAFTEDELQFRNPVAPSRSGYGAGPNPSRNERNGRRGVGRIGRLPL